MSFLFAALFAVVGAHAAERLDQILVSPTRAGTPAHSIPSAVGVVSGEEIEANEGKLDEILRSIPGVAITQNGGPGQTRNVLLRGAKAEHTLVLVDGVPVNDPLSPSRSFDFGQIPVDEIERIEVLRGPQSVLYGSDAIGGVIQIFTKRGSDTRKARASGGSFGSGRASLAFQGFHGSFERSDGISAADAREGNKERDGHRAYRLGGRRDFPLGSDTRWGVQGHYADTKIETDAMGGAGGDSFGTLARQTQLLFRTDVTHVDDHAVTWDGALSLHTRDRDDNTAGPSFFRANLWKAEARARRSFGRHEVSAGGEYQEESGRSSDFTSRQEAGLFGFFLQDHIALTRWHGVLGARVDRHERHGSVTTARSAWGYWFTPERFRVKGSIGSGFKAPSLFQLYSRYGSESLLPEKSYGWDAGFEWRGSAVVWEILWYQNRFRDLIDFDSASSRFFNAGLASTAGVEMGLTVNSGAWTWRNAVTTTRSRDRHTGMRLLRRPTYSWHSELGWARDQTELALAMQWTGPRDDVHPAGFSRQRMPSFVVFGLSGSRRVGAGWKFFGRIDNLFDRSYQETSGFGTPGLSAYAGVEAAL